MNTVLRRVYVFIPNGLFLQSEGDIQFAYELLLLYTPSPYTHT